MSVVIDLVNHFLDNSLKPSPGLGLINELSFDKVFFELVLQDHSFLPQFVRENRVQLNLDESWIHVPVVILDFVPGLRNLQADVQIEFQGVFDTESVVVGAGEVDILKGKSRNYL